MAADDATGGAAPKRMHKDHFFPTAIYYSDLPDADALDERLKDAIRAWRGADPEGTFRTNTPQLGGWHSTTDMHLRPEYDRLTAEILEMAHGIFHDLGYDPDYEPACDSMWVNVNPRHAYNRHHTHPQALWSGVYYVQAPQGCGLLYFTDPRPQTQTLTPYFDARHRAAETWGEVHFAPQEGRLVMFPAWLVHATMPNMSEIDGPQGERISVSFNLHQRRRDAAPDPAGRVVVRADLDARRREAG